MTHFTWGYNSHFRIVWVVFLPWEGRDVTLQSEPGLVLVVTWLTVSHVAISDQWPSDTRDQCRTLSSVVSTHCMDSLRSLNTGGCQIWLEADNGLLWLSLYLWADRLWVAGLGSQAVSLVAGRASGEWLTLELRRPGPVLPVQHTELGSWPGLRAGSGSSGHHQPHQRRQSSRPGDTGHRRGQRHRAPQSWPGL